MLPPNTPGPGESWAPRMLTLIWSFWRRKSPTSAIATGPPTSSPRSSICFARSSPSPSLQLGSPGASASATARGIRRLMAFAPSQVELQLEDDRIVLERFTVELLAMRVVGLRLHEIVEQVIRESA